MEPRTRDASRRPSPRPRIPPVLTLLLSVVAVRGAGATPYDLITVGDPLYEEARLLETQGEARVGPIPFGTRPWQPLQVQEALGAALDSATAGDLSLFRIGRALQRDLRSPGGPLSTPRVLQLADPGLDQRFELSMAIEGRAVAARDTSYFSSGSGVHGRVGASLGGWSGYTHLMVAHVPGSPSFADPLFPEEQIAIHTEEGYLEYTGAPRVWSWSAGAGRERFAWGPGAEGSLLLSTQAPPLTAAWVTAALSAWRLHAATVAATVGGSAGEQLAAHRLEWEPTVGLRLGASEAVRYQAPGWRVLYLISVIPYTLVQRVQVQDEPDSARTLRNNVLGSFDISWRVRPGTRLYGELLLDDLHLGDGRVPNKIAYQLGWEGVGRWGGTRLSWGGEWTRLSQFVYTSFFGRTWTSQGQPLGFATGPDARRVRAWGAWDVRRDWQLRLAAARTDKGEAGLDDPFTPGDPPVESQDFRGRVEKRRELEGAVRYWPASGVDVALLTGFAWIRDADHVRGRTRDERFVALELRLRR